MKNGFSLKFEDISLAKPPREWMPPDAKNRFYDDEMAGLRSYLPGHASLLEVMTSRIYYTLNGCLYEELESFPIMFLRPIGWGCRMAFYLSSIIFCLLSMNHAKNPLFLYTFSRERSAEGVLVNDDTDVFEWFVHFTFAVWVISIVSSMSTYLIGRYSSKDPYETQLCTTFPFFFCNRTAIRSENGSGTRCLLMLVLTVWFAALAVIACAVVHTVIAHAFVTRNVRFLWLLLVFTGLVAMGSLADSISIGGPNGIYVQSRTASWIVSIRAVIVVPTQVIMTGFFCWMCLPPNTGG